MTLRLVKTTDAGFKSLLKNILARRGTREGKVERRVAEIVTAVQKHGDRALLRYTRLFDRLRLTAAALEVKPAEIERATARVAPRIWPPCVSRQNGLRRFTGVNCKKLAVSRSARDGTRPAHHAAGTGWRVCSGRQSILSLDCFDERSSRQSGGC